MQKLRNCSGKGTPAKIPLNYRIYDRCPKAIYLENLPARYLVNLYFDCKDMGDWPAPGGYMAQTAFTIELFEYIDGIVSETRVKMQKERENEAKKNQR